MNEEDELSLAILIGGIVFSLLFYILSVYLDLSVIFRFIFCIFGFLIGSIVGLIFKETIIAIIIFSFLSLIFYNLFMFFEKTFGSLF